MRSILILLLIGACSAPMATDSQDTGFPGGLDPTADNDGDGFLFIDDCDDTDPHSYPGALEICDAADNDCDEIIDEDVKVTLESSANYGSIVEAIAASAPGDTVTVCSSNWPDPLQIDHDLSIRGVGDALIRIDVAGAAPVVTITGGEVVLAGLILSGGSGSAGGVGSSSGGGVQALNAASLVLENCEVRNNEADFGAGLLVGPGGARLIDTSVRDNVGDQGGGVYLEEGSLVCEGGLIGANQAAYGGGLRLHAGTIVEGCNVRENTSTSDGAGAYLSGTNHTMIDGVFEDNVAELYGGGLALEAGSSVMLSGTGISSNDADLGGGIFSYEGGVVSGTKGTTVQTNTAFDGAGVYLWTASLSGMEVTSNIATNVGGGVGIYEGGSLESVDILTNTAEHGGGILLSGQVSLAAVTVMSNSATGSGGGGYASDASVTVDGATLFKDNEANFGGGIYLDSTTVTGGVVDGNRAESGGGFYSSNTEWSALNQVEVTANHANTGGGGLYALSDMELTNVDFVDNTSDVRAGGMYAALNAVTMTDGEVVGNEALDYGGGVYAGESAVVTLTGVSVTDNQSERGGGIYLNTQGTVNLIDSSVLRNGDAKTVSGGGARVTDGNLGSINTDWGSGANDNLPDDVFLNELQESLLGYGNGETFDCTNAGCFPVP